MTTEPSDFSAAAAPLFSVTDTTPEDICAVTALVSLTCEYTPHVTTLPSLLRAIPAHFIWMSTTPEDIWLETDEESPPQLACPHAYTLPSDFRAAIAACPATTSDGFQECSSVKWKLNKTTDPQQDTKTSLRTKKETQAPVV